jgi:ribosomal protein S27AE
LQNEAEKLARIASLRRQLWSWPVVLVAFLLLIWWQLPHWNFRILGIAITGLVGFAFGLLGLSLTQCPRCGGRFFAKRFKPTGNACASCGLQLKPRRVVYPTLE